MLSTISHSTNRSANNRSVQRARPSGGSPQDSAINRASPAPSSSLAGGVVAPYGPGPLRFLPPRTGGAPFPPWRWRPGGTGQPLRPSCLHLFLLHRSATGCAHGLLVRCCPPLGNQGLQFLLLLRGQFDTVFLNRHDAFSLDAICQCRQNTPVVPQFKDVGLLGSFMLFRSLFHAILTAMCPIRPTSPARSDAMTNEEWAETEAARHGVAGSNWSGLDRRRTELGLWESN